MKRIGTRELQLARINIPDPPDLLERMTTQRVRDLAGSLETTNGPLHTPVVRRSDRKLIAGWDRIAACKLMKRERVEVLLVEGTDDEMDELADVENLYRRADDQDAIKARMVARRAARVSGHRDTKLPAASSPRGKPPPPAPPARGRPKSPAGIARHELARETGRTAEAFKQAEKRERARNRDKESGDSTIAAAGPQADGHKDTAPTIPPPPPPIETFGLPLDPELLGLVGSAQAFLDDADLHLRKAQAALTKLTTLEGYDSTKAQDLRETVHRAAHAVRQARPQALCPWCKDQDGIDCMACRDQGFACAGQMTGVPPELLDAANPVISVNGSYMSLETWKSGARAARHGGGELPENRGGGATRNGARNQGVRHGR